jgi:hypothetical protein
MDESPSRNSGRRPIYSRFVERTSSIAPQTSASIRVYPTPWLQPSVIQCHLLAVKHSAQDPSKALGISAGARKPAFKPYRQTPPNGIAIAGNVLERKDLKYYF